MSGSTPLWSTANILPGTAEPALHLVGHQHDPVLVADATQHGHERRRRNDVPAFALHRLDDDRRHGLRGRGGGEEQLELALDQLADVVLGCVQ